MDVTELAPHRPYSLSCCPSTPMIFTRKNAGKWVASKGERVVATSHDLRTLMKRVAARKDKAAIRYDLVPPHNYLVSVRVH